MAQPRRNQGKSKPQDWPTPYPLPDGTAKLVHRYLDSCQNPQLILKYFIKWQDKYEKGQRVGIKINPDSEDYQLLPKIKWDGELLHALQERWGGAIAGFHHRGWELKYFPANLEGRLAIGLGQTTVFETGLTLHHLYGVPIIPGSAVKGVTRAYALLEIAEKLGISITPPEEYKQLKKVKEKSKLEKLEVWLTAEAKDHSKQWEKLKVDGITQEQAEALAKPFRESFGFTGQQGSVIFFDAIPAGGQAANPKFAVDVMTPHYQPYYSEDNKPPADYHDPNPVKFLTVEDTSFLFAVAVKPKNQSLLEPVVRWLKSALQELGIGAKTAAGYGYFEAVA